MADSLENAVAVPRSALPMGWEDSWIRALSADIELGWCPAIRGTVKTIESLIEEGAPVTRMAYAALMVRANELFQIEAKHGKGSALNLAHDNLRHFTRVGSKGGSPLITPQEIENARSFGSRDVG